MLAAISLEKIPEDTQVSLRNSRNFEAQGWCFRIP